MFLFMYICMFVYIYVYMYVRMCIYMCIYICMCVCVCVCVCIHSLRYKHRQTNVCNLVATQYNRLTCCRNRIMGDVAKKI